MAHRTALMTDVCPKCSATLTRENGILRCEAHGAFFKYGPQLLVRLPWMNGKLAETLLPWENRKARPT
ncbi:MAG TPA: hypothetical protein VNL77_10745 [Roseiflexaceae bacterium]|nr:hypothetical protein [Roseiflexaceae bacterium]